MKIGFEFIISGEDNGGLFILGTLMAFLVIFLRANLNLDIRNMINTTIVILAILAIIGQSKITFK